MFLQCNLHFVQTFMNNWGKFLQHSPLAFNRSVQIKQNRLTSVSTTCKSLASLLPLWPKDHDKDSDILTTPFISITTQGWPSCSTKASVVQWPRWLWVQCTIKSMGQLFMSPAKLSSRQNLGSLYTNIKHQMLFPARHTCFFIRDSCFCAIRRKP